MATDVHEHSLVHGLSTCGVSIPTRPSLGMVASNEVLIELLRAGSAQ